MFSKATLDCTNYSFMSEPIAFNFFESKLIHLFSFFSFGQVIIESLKIIIFF